jgi:hypothetical protein
MTKNSVENSLRNGYQRPIKSRKKNTKRQSSEASQGRNSCLSYHDQMLKVSEEKTKLLQVNRS